MPTEAFVDTNVLLRALHSTLPGHDQARTLLDRMFDEECELWMSQQVLREYLVQASHPRTFAPPLTIGQIVQQVSQIEMLFRIANDTPDVTSHLLMLLQTHPTRGKQIHDANIVATMRAKAIKTLLTLNADDFRRFEDQITILTPETTQ